jgi:hypothetical protein
MPPKSRSLRIASSQLAELAAAAVELEAHWNSDRLVVPNAFLPNVRTGRLRQVDVASFRKDRPRLTDLEIYEVRQRGRAQDEGFVDSMIGKAEVLGATGVSLVASSFTSGALRSLQAWNDRARGIILRPGARRSGQRSGRRER